MKIWFLHHRKLCDTQTIVLVLFRQTVAVWFENCTKTHAGWGFFNLLAPEFYI